MDAQTPVQWDVDAADANCLKILATREFHKNRDRLDYPGMINTRALPSPAMCTQGCYGAANRAACLKKHQGIVQSLQLSRSGAIKHLDVEMEFEGKKITLRWVLMSLPFPLITPEPEVIILEEDERVVPISVPPTAQKYLFHSVDFAPDNTYDAEEGSVFITSYKDERKEPASGLVHVLPAYIAYVYGDVIAKRWFHATAISENLDVTFNVDLEGCWNGTWETPDDKLMSDTLDEDMGVAIAFDASELEAMRLQQQKEDGVVTTDTSVDAGSMPSWGEKAPERPLPAAADTVNGVGAPS